MRKKAFTFIEVIIAITIFFLLLVVIVNLYIRMMKTKYNVQAKQSLIQHSYDMMEKVNLLLKDYTIDYEEYFNRSRVWCSQTWSFQRSGGDKWYCQLFAWDGNSSWVKQDYEHSYNQLYHCSSLPSAESLGRTVVGGSEVKEGSGCDRYTANAVDNSALQSFGQYQKQFRDVKDDVDNIPGALWDADDVNVMKWPDAILDPTNVQELYLISQDGKQRLWIRRALIESGDRNGDGIISGDNESRYTLEMLKLRWFDAGNNHDFDMTNSSGVYDGTIDTRACDWAQWFRCSETWVWLLYSGYTLRDDVNDGWIEMFDQDLTTSERNIIIYPTKDPEYALAEDAVQINPYIIISFTNKLYGKIRHKRLWDLSSNDFQFSLQSTFSTKNFYTR